MNSKKWGLGKPTSGEYDTQGELGYKVFGGQGQGPIAKGWLGDDNTSCQKRYMMVNIQTENPIKGASLDVEFSSVPFEKSRKPEAAKPRSL